MLIKAF
jgi:hypothetical protein